MPRYFAVLAAGTFVPWYTDNEEISVAVLLSSSTGEITDNEEISVAVLLSISTGEIRGENPGLHAG
jgi:hypothetical protein